MVNEPANVMTPTRMGEIAKEAGRQYGLNVHVMDSAEMKNLGMGALLGVAQGSCEPPAFIRMDYRGADAASPVTALVPGDIDALDGPTLDDGDRWPSSHAPFVCHRHRTLGEHDDKDSHGQRWVTGHRLLLFVDVLAHQAP